MGKDKGEDSKPKKILIFLADNLLNAVLFPVFILVLLLLKIIGTLLNDAFILLFIFSLIVTVVINITKFIGGFANNGSNPTEVKFKSQTIEIIGKFSSRLNQSRSSKDNFYITLLFHDEEGIEYILRKKNDYLFYYNKLYKITGTTAYSDQYHNYVHVDKLELLEQPEQYIPNIYYSKPDSNIFHGMNCSHGRRLSKSPNVVTFKNKDDAIASGKIKCRCYK